MHADNRELMDRVRAGDICAVIGLKNSITGDTLADRDNPILLESMEFPDTVISMSIAPESRGDRDLLTVETNRGAQKNISTVKYRTTARGGVGTEIQKNGRIKKIVRDPVTSPTL